MFIKPSKKGLLRIIINSLIAPLSFSRNLNSASELTVIELQPYMDDIFFYFRLLAFANLLLVVIGLLLYCFISEIISILLKNLIEVYFFLKKILPKLIEDHDYSSFGKFPFVVIFTKDVLIVVHYLSIWIFVLLFDTAYEVWFYCLLFLVVLLCLRFAYLSLQIFPDSSTDMQIGFDYYHLKLHISAYDSENRDFRVIPIVQNIYRQYAVIRKNEIEKFISMIFLYPNKTSSNKIVFLNKIKARIENYSPMLYFIKNMDAIKIIQFKVVIYYMFFLFAMLLLIYSISSKLVNNNISTLEFLVVPFDILLSGKSDLINASNQYSALRFTYYLCLALLSFSFVFSYKSVLEIHAKTSFHNEAKFMERVESIINQLLSLFNSPDYTKEDEINMLKEIRDRFQYNESLFSAVNQKIEDIQYVQQTPDVKPNKQENLFDRLKKIFRWLI